MYWIPLYLINVFKHKFGFSSTIENIVKSDKTGIIALDIIKIRIGALMNTLHYKISLYNT